MMDAKFSHEDYLAALEEIDRLFDAEPSTPEDSQLESLVSQVKTYEIEHYPISSPTSVEEFEYLLESRGFRHVRIGRFVGVWL